MKKKTPFIHKQVYDPDYLKNGERHVGAKKHGWLKQWKEKKVFKFKWEYCGQCETMYVRCPMCGNNCCNAGFGSVKSMFEPAQMDDPKATTCPVCNLAYEFQHLAWKHKDHPDVSKKAKKEAKKKTDDSLSKIFR